MPTKPNKIKRSRSESEMRIACQRIEQRLLTEGMNEDDDHPSDVVSDMIDELLYLRELKAFLAGFNQQVTVKLARK